MRESNAPIKELAVCSRIGDLDDAILVNLHWCGKKSPQSLHPGKLLLEYLLFSPQRWVSALGMTREHWGYRRWWLLSSLKSSGEL